MLKKITIGSFITSFILFLLVTFFFPFVLKNEVTEKLLVLDNFSEIGSQSIIQDGDIETINLSSLEDRMDVYVTRGDNIKSIFVDYAAFTDGQLSIDSQRKNNTVNTDISIVNATYDYTYLRLYVPRDTKVYADGMVYLYGEVNRDFEDSLQDLGHLTEQAIHEVVNIIEDFFNIH